MKKRLTKLKKVFLSFSLVMLVMPVMFAAGNNGKDIVRAVSDKNGWKLNVNGKDYFVKGVVWEYTPVGENYAYNLFAQGDTIIRKVIDHDFSLMKKAGVNTIRSFAMIPPRWVSYIYKKYQVVIAFL